jgi:molybdopterin-guanine dinucleotide biosynthesis protein A
MQITGIILSGGKSTRMGTDKALIELNKKTLLENAIEICQTVCGQIVISTDNLDHQKFGFKTIPDEFKDCGPLSGIYSCLKKTETEWNFVLSVDAAFVETAFIHELMKHTFNYDAVVPSHKNGREPLIAMYKKSALPFIKSQLLLRNFKMHHLLDQISVNYFNSENWLKKNPRMFHNLNNPEDLQIISK